MAIRYRGGHKGLELLVGRQHLAVADLLSEVVAHVGGEDVGSLLAVLACRFPHLDALAGLIQGKFAGCDAFDHIRVTLLDPEGLFHLALADAELLHQGLLGVLGAMALLLLLGLACGWTGRHVAILGRLGTLGRVGSVGRLRGFSGVGLGLLWLRIVDRLLVA